MDTNADYDELSFNNGSISECQMSDCHNNSDEIYNTDSSMEDANDEATLNNSTLTSEFGTNIDHGKKYGLSCLVGLRHPNSSLSFSHGAVVFARKSGERYYRCCVFHESSEIRFIYSNSSEMDNQARYLIGKGWRFIREPVDMYVTCHGTGLPSPDQPFWRSPVSSVSSVGSTSWSC